MSLCTRCGATFGCAMADGTDEPCWCTRLPPVVPVPAAAPTHARDKTGVGAPPGCWCPACLAHDIARRVEPAPGTDRVG